MAHVYSQLYRLPTTEYVFYRLWTLGKTRYGSFPLYGFYYERNSYKVFNHGNLERDFTYVEDIIHGLEKIIESPVSNPDFYKIYNIGNSKPIKLMDFIQTIENVTGKMAQKQYVEMQTEMFILLTLIQLNCKKMFGYKPRNNYL